MKRDFITVALMGALLALNSHTSASTINRSNGEGLVDDATWRIHSTSADHVTYVRRDGVGPLSDLLLGKVDCNKTSEESSTSTQRSSVVVPLAPSPIASTSLASSSWRGGRGSASSSSNWRQGITQTETREAAGNLQLRSGTSSSDIGGRRRTAVTGGSAVGSSGSAVGSSGSTLGGSVNLIGGSPVSGSLVTRGVIVDGYEGDHLWKVTHRTDDHITYTKRNASGSSWSQQGGGQSSSLSLSQGQGEQIGHQGQLTRFGIGSDSVLARVVKTDDEELTEESLLESQGPRRIGSHSTSELVHPYVKRVNVTEGVASSGLRRGSGAARRKQVKSISGSRGTRTGLGSSSSTGTGGSILALAPTTPSPDDTPPRVGEEINGWKVISKSGDHISWQRVGSIQTSSSSSSASVSIGSAGGQLSLRSLDSSSSVGVSERQGQRLGAVQGGSSRRSGAGGRSQIRGGAQLQLIPSAEGELVEGFPRLFNTYSKSFFSNNPNIENAGSIRTTLSNTENWKVGDELAGWKVISIDDQGLVWEKVSDVNRASWSSSSSRLTSTTSHILNEEDLLNGLGGQRGLRSGVEGANKLNRQGEEDDESLSANKNKGPLGTWYLDKETKNSVTWRRDGVPPELVFDMGQYPRVGDTDSLGQWKVESKSKEHITWTRLSAQPESAEDTSN